MKKLLPIIIAVVGLVGGLAAGTVMKPDAIAGEAHAADKEGGDKYASEDGHAKDGKGDGGDYGKPSKYGKSDKDNDHIYVGLKKPFFAPVLQNNNRHTLIRLDIHLEVPADLEDIISKHEPKLRDGFLRTVMSFAHEGGFSRVHGSEGFEVLSDDLLLSARSVLGNDVKAVLIGEILTRDS